MGLVKRLSHAVTAFRAKDVLPEEVKSIKGSDVEFANVGMNRRVSWSEYRADQAIETAYEKSYYLNTCVDVIVEAVATVPLKVYELSDSGTWEESPSHALNFLLNHPNPVMSRRMMAQRVAGHLLLAGNALWSKIRDGTGTVVELWPLNPDLIEVFPGKNGNFLDRYEYGRGIKKKVLKPEDVVHFMRVNYKTLYWGAGQIQVGQRLIDFDSTSLDWNKVAIQNAGVIPGVLGVKQKLTDKQLQDLREKMRRKRVGMDEAGEDLILGSDITYHRIGSNPHEMEWLESRKLTRQDIAMLMRVPLPMVSIYDDATLANIEQARKIFYLDRIIPFLANLEDGINLSITPEFGDPTRLKAMYDYSDIAAIQDNHFEKARTANVLIRLGFHPQAVNRRLAMGFSDDEVYDEFLVTSEQVRPFGRVGTEAGTRSDHTRLQSKGEKEATVLQWKALVQGKINNELMRELEEVLQDHETGKSYQAVYGAKWKALYLAATESIGKYYEHEVQTKVVEELSDSDTLVRSHLLTDIYNRNTSDDAINKLVSWLYNNWTMTTSETMASHIVDAATGSTND